jgi:hypothetical protein
VEIREYEAMIMIIIGRNTKGKGRYISIPSTHIKSLWFGQKAESNLIQNIYKSLSNTCFCTHQVPPEPSLSETNTAISGLILISHNATKLMNGTFVSTSKKENTLNISKFSKHNTALYLSRYSDANVSSRIAKRIPVAENCNSW